MGINLQPVGKNCIGLAISDGNEVAVASGDRTYCTVLEVFGPAGSPLTQLSIQRDSHSCGVDLQYNGNACCILEKVAWVGDQKKFGILASDANTDSVGSEVNWYSSVMPSAKNGVPDRLDARIAGLIGMVSKDAVSVWDVENEESKWEDKLGGLLHMVNQVFMLDPNTLIQFGSRTCCRHDVLRKFDVRTSEGPVMEWVIDAHIPFSGTHCASDKVSVQTIKSDAAPRARRFHSATLIQPGAIPYLAARVVGEDDTQLLNLAFFTNGGTIIGDSPHGNVDLYAGYEVSLKSDGAKHLFHLQHSMSISSDSWKKSKYSNSLHSMLLQGSWPKPKPVAIESEYLGSDKYGPLLAANHTHHAYTKGAAVCVKENPSQGKAKVLPDLEVLPDLTDFQGSN